MRAINEPQGKRPVGSQVTISTQQSIKEYEPIRGTAQRCDLHAKSAMLP